MYMSNSLASAKRRRAGIQSTAPTGETPIQTAPPDAPTPTQPTAIGRLSLPQLLNNFENRLKAVESSTPTTKSETQMSFNVTDPETGTEKKMSLSDYMTDMDNKFFMLAEEITSMKDILIKLQSFTMEVNKTLMEERVRILSEIPENIKLVIDGEEDTNNVEKIDDLTIV
jgi:hypothetical protein